MPDRGGCDAGPLCGSSRRLQAGRPSRPRYRDWDDLMAYCMLSAAPVGRFLLDLHGGSRAGYAASDALCAALQVINHLQDCQADYRALDRVYIPETWLAEAESAIVDLDRDSCTPGLRAVLDRMLDADRRPSANGARLAARASCRGGWRWNPGRSWPSPSDWSGFCVVAIHWGPGGSCCPNRAMSGAARGVRWRRYDGPGGGFPCCLDRPARRARGVLAGRPVSGRAYRPERGEWPGVVAVVPARDEAAFIGHAAGSLGGPGLSGDVRHPGGRRRQHRRHGRGGGRRAGRAGDRRNGAPRGLGGQDVGRRPRCPARRWPNTPEAAFVLLDRRRHPARFRQFAAVWWPKPRPGTSTWCR